MTTCRGVRGATTVEDDGREQILKATRQLLALMILQNEIDSCDLANAQFTVTADLRAEFPALAARQLGWLEVPMMCGYEIAVDGSLEKCIRVMLLWNTKKKQSEIQHVYLHNAKRLRPDLADYPAVDFAELDQWIQAHLNENPLTTPT